MKKETREKLLFSSFMVWGTITGRCLPQWEDMALSAYSWGYIVMYWTMVLFGIAFILILSSKRPSSNHFL